ncbi:MAG: hypothetical protein KKB38_20630 [Gammaproteobacteria bacterium]|nr:hypothetical protein [Gammaproteobacteria bacterium]
MAYNPSGKSGEFHYLCEMFLDSTTLYTADEDLSIQTSNTSGQFYEGRLPAEGSISRSLGTFLEPKESITSLSLTFDDRDGKIRNLLTEYTVANRRTDVWVGEGVSKSGYSVVFPGVIAHPNGVTWDDETVTFTIIDKRLRARKVLPLDKYDIVTYPNVEQRALNLPVPIVFGDFSSAADNPVQVRAWMVDSTTRTFQVASHGLLGIDRYLKNAIRISPSYIQNVNLAAGTFGLSSAVTYDATNDIMAVNCKGLYTANNTLIESPAGAMKSIYTTFMGLTGYDLNGTAFHTADAATNPDKVRSIINTEVSTETILGELQSEAAFDMRFVGGQYDPKIRNLDLDTARLDFRDADIVIGSDMQEKVMFSAVRDPDRITTNKIRARYAYDTINAQYLGSFTYQLTAAVQEASAILERPMDYNWYYQDSIVQNKVEREVTMFSKEPTQIEMTITARALLKNLADQIDFTYNVFTDRTLQIRSMDLDLASMTVRMGAWDFLSMGMGRWTADSAPAWSSAGAADKKKSGYFTDAAGYADPSDSTSKGISRWY